MCLLSHFFLVACCVTCERRNRMLQEGQKYPNIITPTQIRTLIGVRCCVTGQRHCSYYRTPEPSPSAAL